MGRYSKLRQKVLSGSPDTNVEFSVLCQLLVRLGFEERVTGSHHIFRRSGDTQSAAQGEQGQAVSGQTGQEYPGQVPVGRDGCRLSTS